MTPAVIVCPIDLSGSGVWALARALALARWYGAELHAVYVRPGGGWRGASADASPDESGCAGLRTVFSPEDLVGIRLEPVVLSGDPAATLVDYARLTPADLVVVGHDARRRSRYWMPGALAAAVARGVECPTITVPGGPSTPSQIEPSFRNILCAVDFSLASAGALKQALTLAQQSGGRLTLLHVLEGFPYESVYSGSRAFRLIGQYHEAVEKRRRERHTLVPSDALNWCEIETEVVSGIPHEAIRASAMARKPDLVVIGRPGRGWLDGVAAGSTVSAVLRRTRCAVLTVPGPRGGIERARGSMSGDPSEGERIA